MALAAALALALSPVAARAQLKSNVAGDDWWLPAGTPRAPYSGLYWVSQSQAATLAQGHTQPRYAVNIPVTWSTVEPKPGVFDWSSVDKIVAAVHAMGPGAGFGLWPWYGSKSQIPAWAQSQYTLVFGSNGLDAPWSTGDQWEQAVRPFIQALAARYGADPQLVYVDMRTPFDHYGEFTLPVSDPSLLPAIQYWEKHFVIDYTTAFAGHTHKLVNMISGAGAFYVDPAWKTTFEAMIGDSYGAGTGERDGFPTETKIWHAGFGHLVDADGYLTFDPTHPPHVDGAFYGSECTEFDPTSNRFGAAADTPYRYRLAVLWNLLTRRNWLALALYDTPGYAKFAHWAEIELGQHAATAPDAWSWPKSSVYGNYDIDATSPTTIKNFERWLMQRDVSPGGMTVPTDLQPDGMFGRGGIVKGTEYGARRTDHASGNDDMYFEVDRAFWSGGPHTAWLKVTYRDDCGSGAWHLEYSSPSNADVVSDPVPYGGSGGWKTATFALTDLDLTRRFPSGMDFKLVDSGSCDLTVDFVRLIRPPVSACQAGTTEACGVGACAGQRRCVSGRWSSCDGAQPSPEICDNGIDDDCDGLIDGADPDCSGLLAPRAAFPVTLDGDLADFTFAPPLTFSDPSVSDNTVTVRSLWDDANLYLAFEVDDANVETAPASRDGDVWSHDGVELFLDVNHDGGPTMAPDDYHFIVDANGVVWDGRGTGAPGNNGDVAWNSHLTAAATRTATGYNLEVRLPWADVGGSPAANQKLGLLLVNNDLDHGQLSYFSDRGGTPWAVPSTWGNLTLLGHTATVGRDGGVGDDGGAPTDGGVAPDGGTLSDGGAATDGGAAADGSTPGNGSAPGCGCTSARGGDGLALLALALGLLALRRRRAGHPPGGVSTTP